MPTLLYYPRINPSKAVLYQGILYWDAIASIVPPGISVGQPLNSDMLRVHDAGLYQPVTVSEYENSDWVGADFLRALQNTPDEKLRAPEEATVDYGLGVGDSDPLVAELKRRNLGFPIHGTGTWGLGGGPQTILISILARALAEQRNAQRSCTSSDSMRPYTDSGLAYGMAYEKFERGLDDEPQNSTKRCWKVPIGPLLPIPCGDVLVSDVIAFRKKYDDERKELLLAIDNLLHELQQGWDNDDAIRDHFQRNVKAAVANLNAAARSTRRAWLTRSISACIALGSAASAVKLPTLAWLLGALGGAAINVATTEVRRGATTHTEYSYLLHVNSAQGFPG